MTLFIRILLFPFAHKAYKSIAKVKLLAPKVEEIKERFGENKLEAQKATMELYRKEKVNPMSSIVPLLLQIPVFIALFKTLRVSISLRHSVFIPGWIEDLSAPEPTSIFNAFGLIKIPLPQMFQIGMLPILMGLTMWLQQKASDTGSSATKAIDKRMMTIYMPILLTFFFARFPSGLMIYWIVSNCFTILQQLLVNEMYGSKEKRKKLH
jgi:YidC/Oxa1 family membrane protein insertase